MMRAVVVVCVLLLDVYLLVRLLWTPEVTCTVPQLTPSCVGFFCRASLIREAKFRLLLPLAGLVSDDILAQWFSNVLI